jgi:hypothetical protein
MTDRSGAFRLVLSTAADNRGPSTRLFFAEKFSSGYTALFNGNELYFPCIACGNIQVWVIFYHRLIWGIISILLVAAVFIAAPLIKSKKGFLLHPANLRRDYAQVQENNAPITADMDIYADLPETSCYRERIIILAKRLFNRINAYPAADGAKSAEKLKHCAGLTPREMSVRISSFVKDINPQALEEFVSIYEKAAYSLKDILKEDFEKFYSHFAAIRDCIEIPRQVSPLRRRQ